MEIRTIGMEQIPAAYLKAGAKFFPAIEEQMTAGVAAGAMHSKTTIKAMAPERLRGAGSKKTREAGGSKIYPFYRLYTSGTTPYAAVQAAGPYHWWERGTRKHQVPAQGGKWKSAVFGPAFATRNVSKAKVGKLMSFGEGQAAYGPFLAGGSEGHHTFAKGKEIVRPKIKTVMEQAQRRALIKTMA